MPRDVGYGLSGVVFLSTDAFFQINFGGLCGTARHGAARRGTARHGTHTHARRLSLSVQAIGKMRELEV